MRSLLIALTLLAACGGTNHLRDAQRDFSEAARLENKTRFQAPSAPDAGAELGTSVEIQNLYAGVLLSLDRITSQDKARLQADGLWGSVLSLRAMTYWRLGQFDKALKAADDMTDEVGDQALPRDAVMMAALPGLIRVDESNLHDEIRAFKRQPDTKAKIEAAFDRLTALTIADKTGAIAIIQRARNGMNDKDHPVHIYLIQSQLAAYRNYQSGYQLKNQDLVPSSDPAKTTAEDLLKELKRLLAADKSTDGTVDEAIITKWVDLTKLSAP
jgi:hypothetical protein